MAPTLHTSIARDFAGRDAVATSPADLANVDDCARVFEGDFSYVLRTLQRMGASRADAEDLTQEVFLVMWRRRRDWNPAVPLRPWLAAVAYRVALAHRRRSQREVPVGLLDAEDGSGAIEEQLSAKWARRTVLETLTALPPKQRVVLVMHELDGVAVKEIASVLGLPLFTAYSRLRMARQRFAREIRRRQVLGLDGRRRDKLTTLPAAALLELERPIPGVPAAVKQRVLHQLQQQWPLETQGAESALTAGPSWSLPARFQPLAAMSAAAGLIVIAGLGALALLHGAPSAGASEPVRPAVIAASTPRVRALAAVGSRGRAPNPPSLLASAGPQAAAAEALRAGLTAYWRFDEPRGTTTARDVSGLSPDCVLRRIDSTDWIDGVFGKAIRLAGGGWVECPAGAGMRRITNQVTISAWVMRGQLQHNLRSIVSRQHATGRRDDLFLGFVYRDLIFSGRVWGTLQVRLPEGTGRWFHVAAVGDRDGGVRLYLDGVEIASAPGGRPGTRPDTSLADAPFDNPLLVGAANNDADPTRVDQKLNGAVDELLVYDRALPAREISQLAEGVQPRL